MPTYRAISPPPPIYRNYLTIEDLFGRRSAASKSCNHQIRPSSRITTASDDPFIRQFISPSHHNPHQWVPRRSMRSASISTWKMSIGNSHKLLPDSAGAMCSSQHRWQLVGLQLLLRRRNGAAVLESKPIKICFMASVYLIKSHGSEDAAFLSFGWHC